MTRIPRTRTLALLFAGSLAATSLAAAQPSADKPGRHGKRFDKLDANKDGAVTLEEMKAATRARIAGADSNSDGRVTADEMKAHRKARRAEHADKRNGKGKHGKKGKKGKRFAKKDANGDGKLSRDEIPKMSAEHFERADTNKDGFLTHDEMKAGFKHGKHHRKGKRFGRIDADNNGTLEPAEIDAHAAKRFERIDADNDGKVTRAEMKAARKHHRKGKGKHHRRGKGKHRAPQG